MTKGQSILEELEPLFNPKSVAVVGATNQWNKWGFSTFVSLLDGFRGKIYPVNNKEDVVLGHKAYRRVIEIPPEEPVDLAVFVIPAASIPGVMEDCIQKGVRAAVIISAGFAEIGAEGRKLQDRVLGIARQGPLHFIGPNCMGFWSAPPHLKSFMFPLPVRPGPLALVSQGGNVGGAVLQAGYLRGLGFQFYVSCGCTADIQVEDYIEYFSSVPEVKVILAYIEGLNDGQRFIEKVRRVTAQKPVIALKPGKTEAATKAITSHSGALSGSSEIFDSAIRKAGGIRVDSAEELLDVATAFITQPLPQGRNVAIITPGGSYGVISADACASLGLNVVPLSQDTLAEFNRIFPPRWSRGNPVDPAGDRNFIAYLQAPDLLLKLPEVDSMIFMGFDSFSRFASVFATLSQDLSQVFKKLTQSLSQMVPEGTLRGSLDDDSWMNGLIQAVVRQFFSLFGTSEPTEVQAFAEKLISLLRSGKTGPHLKRKFVEVLRSLKKDSLTETEDPFTQLFSPMLQALVLNWTETYRKPVVTTTFMGNTTSMTDMGYYAYPSAERAALVLAKLVEYREFLDRL